MAWTPSTVGSRRPRSVLCHPCRGLELGIFHGFQHVFPEIDDELRFEQCDLNLCWLMIVGDDTTQPIKDYNNPLEESL